MDLGSAAVPAVEVPSEDRNRTSPFPYGGHRFEFRAVGSSQNVSLVNTVLATIVANSFKEFADAIEAGQSPKTVAQQALKEHWKAIFNGNGYDPANQRMLTENGVWRIDSGVDAICRFTAPKNVKLFESLKVLTAEECAARQNVLLTHYIGTVEIEAGCMIDMINQEVLPAVREGGVGPLNELVAGVKELQDALAAIHHAGDAKEKADLARTLRLETMTKVRAVCDAAEAVVPAKLWTMATYKELLFLDQHV
jgi:glutamine synthetase